MESSGFTPSAPSFAIQSATSLHTIPHSRTNFSISTSRPASALYQPSVSIPKLHLKLYVPVPPRLCQARTSRVARVGLRYASTGHPVWVRYASTGHPVWVRYALSLLPFAGPSGHGQTP